MKKKKMNNTPSWQLQNRSMHIKKVVIIMITFFVILALIITGFVYPKCNETQVHGFFRCNCPQGSAMDKLSGLCTCLNNGTELGNQCEEGAEKVRYVFKSLDKEKNNNWIFTNAAIWQQ